MSAPQAITQDIVLGAGYIYFDEQDANGNSTGRRYLGDTPGFSLSVTSEKTEIESSDAPVAETLVTVVKKIVRSGSLSINNINADNLSMFIMGAAGTVTQTATPVVAEAISSVNQGRYYQLGASTSNPSGVRDVSSVAVKGSGGTPTYTVNTDYIVNADDGTIYIVPGGGISDGTDIEVDYTPAANSREQVVSDALGASKGELHFKAANTEGTNRDVLIPLVELAPNGDLPLKDRDNPVSMTFDLNISTRTGYEQLYIDGVAA